MENAVREVLEANVLRAAQTIESQLDEQLHKLDNLEEDDLERIRMKRLEEIKRMQSKHQEWVARGHGELQEVSEKDFFAEMKGEERLVCHFYRSSIPCQVMDMHLTTLAKKHLETRFLKLHAEKAPFLTERLKIWMLPTLAIIKSEKTTDYVVGFDELGGKEDFPTGVLEARLVNAGVLFESDAAPVPRPAVDDKEIRTVRKGGESNFASMVKSPSDEDSDFD